MKTSNKIIVGTVLLFVTVIFIMMIVMRTIVGGYDDFSDNYEDFGETETITYNYQNFSKLDIADNWIVTIRQGERYAIEVTSPVKALERTAVEINGDRLIFKNKFNRHRKGEIEAFITMPSVEVITVEDVAMIEMEDFTCDELQIRVKGACKLRGYGNKIDNLHLESEGTSRVDLIDSSVKNAELDLEGAGIIELTMDGGDLTGRASGAAKIVYYGKVKNENLKTSGVVTVRKRD